MALKSLFNNKLNTTLVLTAAILGLLSFVFTSQLVEGLAQSEREHIRLYSQTYDYIIKPDSSKNIETMIWENLIRRNNNVPVIIADTNDQIKDYNNIKLADNLTTAQQQIFLSKRLKAMKHKYPPIFVNSNEYIYYDDSTLLFWARHFPEAQVAALLTALIIFILLFTNSKRAERNRIWAGMAKETAHQLATPVSGLNGWLSFLDEEPSLDAHIVAEIRKDVERLENITERFSSIGSKPNVAGCDLLNVCQHTVDYLKKRTSKRIQLEIYYRHNKNYTCRMNSALFSWVIENLCKNAINAIQKTGKIALYIGLKDKYIFINVKDNGAGIPHSKFAKIFEPGYSTREKGWGLGLSLAKRIIEDYHHGHIKVYKSKVGIGTTFQILMPKNS